MIIGWTTLDFRHQRVFALFLNDLGTTTDDKLFLRQSLAGSLLLVNILFEDADWSSTTRSCEVGGRPQSAFPIPLHQVGPFLSEHSAGHAFQRVDFRSIATPWPLW